ncbi:hypothetical protein D6779_06230 [Candidatus Parcubacteria bacterium]|nr:MAG: hypothetical protein D6779_06230 [Candidatus Parcubacteria bacterium]
MLITSGSRWQRGVSVSAQIRQFYTNSENVAGAEKNDLIAQPNDFLKLVVLYRGETSSEEVP